MLLITDFVMDKNQIDIKESYLYRPDQELLSILLKDRSSGKNIIWATDNYAYKGAGFHPHDHIEISSITGYHGNVVKPRVKKSQKEQIDRIKQKAEVFTPSWICNKQNNLVDNAWFGVWSLSKMALDSTAWNHVRERGLL